MLTNHKIGVLGAGNMGTALIAGIVKASIVEPRQITAVRRNSDALDELAKTYAINTTKSNCELVTSNEIIILAVKPQMMTDVLAEVSHCWHEGQIVISIVAGISTGFIESYVGHEIPVIRVMPNTPALVGQAMSPYCLGRWGSATQALVASQIFSAVGVTVQVEESMMDTITAMSGTGPAYIFYLLEGLIEAGVEMGLPEHVSRALVRQTAFGAAKLVTETTKSPEQLRAQVTSPQGTTHAAMTHLDDNGCRRIVKEAVNRARERAGELGREVENRIS